jgi:hypothetical protein
MRGMGVEFTNIGSVTEPAASHKRKQEAKPVISKIEPYNGSVIIGI